MGTLCWRGTMIGYVRNIIIIFCLNLSIIWTKIAYSENDILGNDGWIGLDDVTRVPVTTTAPAISDFEMLRILHIAEGTPFPVICIRDYDGLVMKRMTRGAGKKYSEELCGPGEHPSIPPGGGEHLKPGGCT